MGYFIKSKEQSKGNLLSERFQSALSQAVILDPYAKAVMKTSLERIRALGDGQGLVGNNQGGGRNRGIFWIFFLTWDVFFFLSHTGRLRKSRFLSFSSLLRMAGPEWTKCSSFSVANRIVF